MATIATYLKPMISSAMRLIDLGLSANQVAAHWQSEARFPSASAADISQAIQYAILNEAAGNLLPSSGPTTLSQVIPGPYQQIFPKAGLRIYYEFQQTPGAPKQRASVVINASLNYSVDDIISAISAWIVSPRGRRTGRYPGVIITKLEVYQLFVGGFTNPTITLQ